MHQGNWTCSKCGGAITQLPFEPRSNSGLTCRDCYFNSKGGSGAPGGGVAPDADAEAAAIDAAAGASAADDRTDVPDFDPSAFAGAGEPAPEPPEFADAPVAEKETHTGDWKCATCGGAIASLPFVPRSTDNLKCLDCFKASKA